MLLTQQHPKHLRLGCSWDDGPSESPDSLSRAMGNLEGINYISGSSERPLSTQRIPETQFAAEVRIWSNL